MALQSHWIAPRQSHIQSPLQLEIYATNWGFKGSMDEFCAKAKEEGYDGIEVWTPMKENQSLTLIETIEKYNLKLGLLAGNWGSNYHQHYNSFQASLRQAISLHPQFINCHSGKDYFTIEQGQSFIDLSHKHQSKSNIPIYHETHRGRLMYAAHVCNRYIQQNNHLRLTLDISHWCNVHESYLGDIKSTVDQTLAHVDHIHARIGFPQGPQIPDHRDAQFEKAVLAHFNWWDIVVDHKIRENKKLTMTTEFGPPPYMWTQLASGEPLADNWTINRDMMHLWRSRYTKN